MSAPSGNDVTIRSLYKSLNSIAEHHEPELIEKIHIATPIEDAIVLAANKGKVVIITGNPGDGKTHLIRKVEGEFPKKKKVNKDANEVDDDDIIKSIDEAFTNKTPVVIAINEGILLDICEKAKKRHVWPGTIIEAILKPYVYGDEVRDENDRLCVLDLDLRNNLSRPVVEQAIGKVLALAGGPESPLHDNVQRLRDPVVRERIVRLLDAVARTGFHATMRDLLAFITYMICGGGEDPKDAKPRAYYLNAFNGGIGPIFDRVREFDPLSTPEPFLDYRLYMAEDVPDEWEYVPPGERLDKEDLDLFRERKRRAYFEHKDGDKILRPERGDIDKYFEKLMKPDQSPETVAIGLLNRFFDANDDQADYLVLWVGHQFSAQATRYVASRQVVSVGEFVVTHPRLPSHLRDVFTDHYPDHVIFKHKDMSISDGLVIDRRFLSMLIAGDRTSGLGSRNPEAYSKISAFYDRLARASKNQQNTVQILRLDNLSRTRIGVSVSDHAYFIPGA